MTVLKSHEIAAYHEWVMMERNTISSRGQKMLFELRAYSIGFGTVAGLTFEEIERVIGERKRRVVVDVPGSMYNDFIGTN